MSVEPLERRTLFAAALGQVLKDINPGAASSLAEGVSASVAFDNKTYFAATTPDTGTELWATDGTDTGTTLVADLAAGTASSRPRDLVVSGGKLFFVADYAGPFGTAAAEAKVYISDGTAAGTTVVAGSPYAFPPTALYGPVTETAGEPTLVAFNGGVAFVAPGTRPGYVDDPDHTFIWTTDGTVDGTSYKQIVNGGNPGSVVHDLTATGTTLTYVARSSDFGDTIGRTTSTSNYSSAVTPPDGSVAVGEMVAVGASVYFNATPSTAYGSQLYKIDSVGALTSVADIDFRAFDLVAVNGKLLVSGGENYGGYAAFHGLYSVSDVPGGLSVSLLNGQAYPDLPLANLTAVGKSVYYDQTRDGPGLYVTRYDAVAGTFTPLDLDSGEAFTSVTATSVAGPAFVQGPDGAVYFEATPLNGGTGLYRATTAISVLSPFPVYLSDGGTVDTLPAGFMTVGNDWYAAGTSPQFGREWRLIERPLGAITGYVQEAVPGQTAGAYPLNGNAGVSAYLDTNANGRADAGEPTSTLDLNGTFRFDALPAGRYTVRLTAPAGTQFVTPAGGVATVTVAEDTPTWLPAFLLRTPKAVTVTLFNDANASAARDNGEAPLSGRKVYVDANNNGLPDTGETTVLTNGSGAATFSLYDGTYTIRQVLPAGWSATTTDVSNFLVRYAGSYFNLGSKQATTYAATVSGTAFNDANGNAALDAGESVLAGRTIFVDADNDGLLDTGERSVVTGTTGAYSFTGFLAGNAVVRQVVPKNWQQTSPAGSAGNTISVTGAATFAGRNFASRQVPADPDTVTYQAESATLSGGATVATTYGGYTGTGYAQVGPPNAAVTWTFSRNSAGTTRLNFRFANGSSTNRELAITVNGVDRGAFFCGPTGSWTAWATASVDVPLVAGTNSVKLAADTSFGGPNVDSLVLTQPATPPTPSGVISGFAFDDANKNGLFDSGDTKTAGRTVFLDKNANGLLDAGDASVTTGTNGVWTFSGLAAGTYAVREIFASGAAASTLPIDVTLTDGQVVADLALGTKTTVAPPSTGSLSGYVFDDTNKNGVYDAGETKPSGKTVYLDANNNGLLDGSETKVTTSTNGVWAFGNLAAGTYHVRRVCPSGYSQSNALVDVTLAAGQTVGGLGIGSRSGTATPVNNASIAGFAFDDKNKNGVYDSGDALSSGKTIYLDLDDDGVKDAVEASVVTDASGKFAFGGLAARAYHVRRVFPTGYAESTPARSITLTSGQAVTGVSIGSKVK